MLSTSQIPAVGLFKMTQELNWKNNENKILNSKD